MRATPVSREPSFFFLLRREIDHCQVDFACLSNAEQEHRHGATLGCHKSDHTVPWLVPPVVLPCIVVVSIAALPTLPMLPIHTLGCC